MRAIAVLVKEITDMTATIVVNLFENGDINAMAFFITLKCTCVKVIADICAISIAFFTTLLVSVVADRWAVVVLVLGHTGKTTAITINRFLFGIMAQAA